jgi:hypothetical protein
MNEQTTNLTERIKEQTADLKVEFLAQTRIWANAEFTQIESVVATPRKSYGSFFEHLSPEERRNAWATRTADAHRAHRSYETARDAAERIVRNGLDAFVARAEKMAVDGYDAACAKLAVRIIKKGLNADAIEITTARVGVNIETTFTDGNKSVRAFTIVASGAVQKPHYRYLVK